MLYTLKNTIFYCRQLQFRKPAELQEQYDSGLYRERRGALPVRPLPVLPPPAATEGTNEGAASQPSLKVQDQRRPVSATHVQVGLKSLKLRKTLSARTAGNIWG